MIEDKKYTVFINKNRTNSTLEKYISKICERSNIIVNRGTIPKSSHVIKQSDVSMVFISENSEDINEIYEEYRRIQTKTPLLGITDSSDIVNDMINLGFNDFLLLREEIDNFAAIEKKIENLKRAYKANDSMYQNSNIDGQTALSLLNRAPAVIAVLDENMGLKFIEVHGEAVDLDAEQVNNSNDLLEKIHPEDRESVYDDFKKSVQKPNKLVKSEFRAKTRNGEWEWFESLTQNLIGYDNIDGIYCLIRNIEERKQREEDYIEQRDRLDRVVSVMSHDLRNLLNVASARVKMINEKYDDQNIEPLVSSLGRMEELVNDSLDLANHIDERDRNDKIDLMSVVNNVEKNIVGNKAEVICECNVSITANESRFINLIENIICNSVEHNNNDDLRIRVGCMEDGFYIEDNGSGIPESERKKIFNIGHSGSNSTGLGLKIVHDVVDAHNWNISLKESKDGGARFEITGIDTINHEFNN